MWLVFSYSLPVKRGSALRVNVWRRLQRAGALAQAGGVHVLPARDECVETFNWLTSEVRQNGGEALLMRVAEFGSLSAADLSAQFVQDRESRYQPLATQLEKLERHATAKGAATAPARLRSELRAISQKHATLALADYFEAPLGRQIAARIRAIQQLLSGQTYEKPTATLNVVDYRAARWVTRPHIGVDRIACIWLIRRHIAPAARIRFSDLARGAEIPFDMPGVRFGHHGRMCSFEVMLQTFGLATPASRALALIVHALDLRDAAQLGPEARGIDAVLRGWQAIGMADAERALHGCALLDGLAGGGLIV